MTEAEFFKHLASLKKKEWRLTAENQVRCKTGDCPITAVARKLGVKNPKNDEYLDVAEEIGLSQALAVAMVEAADNSKKEILDSITFPATNYVLDHPDRAARLRPRILRTIGMDWM